MLHQPMTLDQAEKPQYLLGGWTLAAPLLRIYGQLLDFLSSHRLPDFTLDESLHEKREEIEKEERLDSPFVLEENRGYLVDRFEVPKASFHGRLPFMRLEYLARRESPIVREKWIQPVAFAIVSDLFIVERPFDVVTPLRDSPVSRIRARASSSLLPVTMILPGYDPHIDIPRGVGPRKDLLYLLSDLPSSSPPRSRTGQLLLQISQFLFGLKKFASFSSLLVSRPRAN